MVSFCTAYCYLSRIREKYGAYCVHMLGAQRSFLVRRKCIRDLQKVLCCPPPQCRRSSALIRLIAALMQALDFRAYIDYREWTFLSHPQVPRHTLWDRDTVYMYPPGAPQPARYASLWLPWAAAQLCCVLCVWTCDGVSRYGAGVNLVAGPALDDVALKAELAGVAERSILHFDNLEPHSFAGFRSDKARSSTAV